MAETPPLLLRYWQEVRRLSWGERWLLIETLVLLPLLDLGMRLLGLRRLRATLAWLAPAPGPAAASGPAGLSQALAVANVVQRAAWHSPLGSTCLTRSLVLWWLLRRRGIAGELCIGVAKEAAQFQAHAWVECQGMVLNDDDQVRQRFAVLDLGPDLEILSEPSGVVRMPLVRPGAVEGRKPR